MNFENIRLIRIDSIDDDCGGTDVFIVEHKQAKVRLHYVKHQIYPGSREVYTAIHDWADVWEHASYQNERWPKKYKGKLTRGIMQHDGNGIHAFVEWKDKIYFIHGVWG